MHEPPLDLDTLLQRLRAAAAEHGDAPGLPPVAVRPWQGGPHGAASDASISGPGSVSGAVPWDLVARHGGLAPYLLADEAGFVALAYRQLLARTPDAGGQAHLLERLRQHAPRTELLAELALSPEAQELGMDHTRAGAWLWTMRLLLRAAQSPHRRVSWLVRGVLRRSERALGQRAQRSPLGMAWHLALQQVALQVQLRQSQALTEQLQDQASAAFNEHEHLANTLAQHQAEAGAQLALLAEQQCQQDGQLTSLSEQQVLLGTQQTQSTAQWQRVQAVLQLRLQTHEQRLAVQQQQQQQQTAESAAGLAGPAADVAGAWTAAAQVPLADDTAAEDTAAADFLAALEVGFRGPVEALRAQLERDYLHHLQALRTELGGSDLCLDLGCGRGVWLELLQTHGFAARGIDLNRVAVAEAQALGLPVEHGDALAWLRAQPEGSVLAVTAFHLMEHLPFGLRLALVTECARVLRPGGLLIMETPNPENIWVATHTFHHDPTHSQPLTPDSLEFLVNYCGLQTVAVPRLHPYPPEANLPGDDAVTLRLNHMTCGGQDFAVLAQKPR